MLVRTLQLRIYVQWKHLLKSEEDPLVPWNVMVNLLVNLLDNPFLCNLDARKFYQSILIIRFRFSLPFALLIDGIKLGSQFLTYFSLNANLYYQHLSTSVSMPSGKLETLRNASRREVFKVSSTDAMPGKPLPDSSQVFSRAEKGALCGANDDGLLAGLHQFRKLGLWEEWVCLAFFSSRLRSQSFSFKHNFINRVFTYQE